MQTKAATKLTRSELSLAKLLTSAVQGPIDVFSTTETAISLPAENRSWFRVATFTATSDRDEEAEPVVAEPPVALLEKASKADRPVGESLGDGSLVAVRLGSGSDAFAVAAAGESESEVWLARLFSSVLAHHRSVENASQLSEENDSFASQLAADLEELSFLRSVVQRLTTSRGDTELTEMARTTLPVLNATVKAKCLAFLSIPDQGDPYQSRVEVLCGAGRHDHGTLEAAVRRFGQHAVERPVVRNWEVHDLPDSACLWDDMDRVPGVQALVLAPLKCGDRMLGWLLALDRAYSPATALESPWQLASDEFGTGEATLMATTASILATHASNLDLLREKEQLMIGMVRALVSAIESKDHYTRGHSERVALFTKRIAEEAGYSDLEVENIYLSALLHDVGKIGVADAVLKKEGKLTDEEFAEIMRHPDEGWSILSGLEQLSYILPGVLHHHERWDGAGYPDSLAGETIPLDGRVMAVADAYDAMTSDRPYRKGMPTEKAESIIREGAGTQWDPQMVDAFFACIEDIREIRSSYRSTERKVRKAPLAAAQAVAVGVGG